MFTVDYLQAGITETTQFQNADVTAMRAKLADLLTAFPHDSKPNEATTEKDVIWPIMESLGWHDYLTQQNLSASGRVDVPDGLLFIDADAKAKANAHPKNGNDTNLARLCSNPNGGAVRWIGRRGERATTRIRHRPNCSAILGALMI